MRHFRFGKLLVLFLLALATALPSIAEEPNRRPPEFWGPRDGERFRERGERLLAKNPRSMEGLNMMGMLYIVDWRVNDDAKAASYFQKSWSVQPNPMAALALAQIAGRDRGEDSDANVARWALRAMEFPGPSLTALALFERAVNSRPELAKLETAKVRKLRAHRQRWRDHVKKRTKSFSHARIGVREEDRRLPADDGRAFELVDSEVVAKDKNGGVLWRQKVEEPEVKLVATGPRVFVISPDWVEVWNAADGQALHKWPSLIKTNIDAPAPPGVPRPKYTWNVWNTPDSLIGADDENLWYARPEWFMVFRQKDAGGWAHYWTHWFLAVPSDDAAMYISWYGWFVAAVDKRTGKDIWGYGTPWHGTLSVLDVTEDEIVVYSPQTEKILGLSRKTGTVNWSETHSMFWRE